MLSGVTRQEKTAWLQIPSKITMKSAPKRAP
jgi:hypothetical protein